MISLVCGLLLANRSFVGPLVSTQSLLREIADISGIAKLPAIGYRQLHASSYDRAQTDPNNSKTWFANADYGQFIRTEQQAGKTEWVVMEHHGPGAITHIWTPLLGEKDKMLVRFYFDGASQPSIEVPFNDLMRGKSLIKGPYAFISWPDKGVESGVGSDLYYPIPFAKSCKVTMTEVPFYYSFDYRAYPKGTPVETFTRSNLDRDAKEASTIGERLNHPRFLSGSRGGSDLVTVRPGGEYIYPLTGGPRMVDAIEMRFDKLPDLQELRSNVIEMSFDGEQAVWCPIGEFFGSGVHSRPVWDRYRTVLNNGQMSSFWPMPFAHSGSLRFHNFGKTPIAFRVYVESRAWQWDAQSMHFHATWRNQYPLATRPMSDWNYLTATGKGVYVGDTLTVFSPAAGWYGEGDERIYVDREKFPSHLGTGTEDYYGYAWGMAEHFSSPFIAMPARDLKGRENWMGYTTTSRIRGLDAIPFDQSLKFDMEIWDWADCKVGYSATSFWYARPGATSNRQPSPKEAAALLPEWSAGIKGAIECETMKLLSHSEGVEISTQSAGLTEGSWSGGMQLFAQCTKPGQSVHLQFPVKKSGRYHVIVYATKSYDYGIVRFSINGKTGKNVDLWSEKPIASGPIDLGAFDLIQGAAEIAVEAVGSNPKSRSARYYIGLDCLVLK